SGRRASAVDPASRIAGDMRLPGATQQVRELLERIRIEMPELLLVHRLYLARQAFQQRQPGGGEGNVNRAAVLGFAFSNHELALLQSVEHPRDVGTAGNQSPRKLQRGERFGSRRGEQSQGVVLLCRQLV